MFLHPSCLRPQHGAPENLTEKSKRGGIAYQVRPDASIESIVVLHVTVY
eukprot:COSAG02_NODE_9421_length_2222_cov_1.501178_1_plen_48_part_10